MPMHSLSHTCSTLLPYRRQEILLSPTQSRIRMTSLRMWLLHLPLSLSDHVFQNEYPESRPLPHRYVGFLMAIGLYRSGFAPGDRYGRLV